MQTKEFTEVTAITVTVFNVEKDTKKKYDFFLKEQTLPYTHISFCLFALFCCVLLTFHSDPR